jgi:hypothetical protein
MKKFFQVLCRNHWVLPVFLSPLFTSHLFAGEVSEIRGSIRLDIIAGTIKEEILIINPPSISNRILFTLHEYLNLDSVFYNELPVTPKPDSSVQHGMNKIYSIDQTSSPGDQLRFFLSGEFPVIDSSSNYSFRSDYDMISSYGIFRANGVAAWHPVILPHTGLPVAEIIKAIHYDYSLEIDCPQCSSIFTGYSAPVSSTAAIKGLMSPPLIIAGNYDWRETREAFFINLDISEQQLLQHETGDVVSYYEQLTGIPFEIKPAFAKVEMNISPDREFAFYSAPVTVFVNMKGRNIHSSSGMISHELAHYYFGNIFVPRSNLYWFFLESCTEYLSFKYKISQGKTEDIKEKYAYLSYVGDTIRHGGLDFRFVRLDQVLEKEDIHYVQRYVVSPFQLLAIENQIGEVKMMGFLKHLFSIFSDDEDGYITMLRALKETGADVRSIKTIEEEYIRSFNLSEYVFMEAYF